MLIWILIKQISSKRQKCDTWNAGREATTKEKSWISFVLILPVKRKAWFVLYAKPHLIRTIKSSTLKFSSAKFIEIYATTMKVKMESWLYQNSWGKLKIQKNKWRKYWEKWLLKYRKKSRKHKKKLITVTTHWEKSYFRKYF